MLKTISCVSICVALMTFIASAHAAEIVREEIAIAVAKDTVLAGTVTHPATPPRAVMVMITGAGPHSRDGVISGAPMFAQLADALAAGGIATIRVDEAGVGESTGQVTASFLERVPHVRAVLDQAREIFPEALVGLYGHSEGASLAVLAAHNQPDDVDFLVLAGAPAAPGRTVWVDQQYTLLAQQFAHFGEAALEEVRAALASVAEASSAGARDRTYASVQALFETLRAPQSVYEDGSFEQYASRMASTEMRDFLSYDPLPAFREVTAPVLAIWGSLDRQTSPSLNGPLLAAASNASSAYTAIVLDQQDHFFLRGEGLEPGEHRFGRMHLASELPRAILAWIESAPLRR